jgi:hypothetical protein
MENGIQSPQPVTQTPIQTSTNWSRIILFTVLGLIVATGSVFIGIQIGKNQVINTNPIITQLTISPTYPPVDTNIDTKNQVEFRGWFSII